MLRTITAARYVLPLREGGSLPALVEGSDDGLYVVKLRGAGQGLKALIAELIAGELGRAVGLRVPEIVFIELSSAIADAEPDPEISDLLEASAGLNLALDYLPGSITFDPVAGKAPDAAYASRVVLFDSFVINIDRSPKNPNLLSWHDHVWLIDHGASLYFHHGWGPKDQLDESQSPFAPVRQHVLLPWATALTEAASALRAAFTQDLVERVVDQIPAEWLSHDEGFSDVDALRAAYRGWLDARTEALPIFLTEAERARAELV